MLYGMSYEEFWHGQPILARFYREKHRLEIEQINQELWLQGLYIFDAVGVVMQNSFSKKKAKYLEKPLDLFPKTEEEKLSEVAKTREKIVEKLNAFKDAFDKQNGVK